MPNIEIIFYREAQEIPVLDWLDELQIQHPRAYAKCVAQIQLLAHFGHELRRPLSDYLDEGIYELRIRRGHVNYRILYFFHGRYIGVLTHCLTKEGRVPPQDLKRAIERKRNFEADPDLHTYEGGLDHG